MRKTNDGMIRFMLGDYADDVTLTDKQPIRRTALPAASWTQPASATPQEIEACAKPMGPQQE